jgi:hyperosmotically inducible protein
LLAQADELPVPPPSRPRIELAAKPATADAAKVPKTADAKKAADTAIQVAGDTAIAARVKAALVAEKNVKSTDVSVDAFQGRVILRGTVPDAEQIALAARVARAVDGVKSVDNRLVVN